MEVKGTAVLSIPRFIEEKFGDEGLQKWLNSLSDEAKNVYSQNILASKWYPMNEILVHPTRELCKLFYSGSIKGAWEAGRFSANHALNGVLKIFVKLGTPGFIISRSTSILPSFYHPSEIKVIESDSNRCVICITQFSELSDVIENRIGGWMERALEIQGCKGVSVKITKSVTKNDTNCQYTVTWN